MKSTRAPPHRFMGVSRDPGSNFAPSASQITPHFLIRLFLSRISSPVSPISCHPIFNVSYRAPIT